jgi:tRNA A-37 threonylcarbamoyl transferase component Bud32
LNGESLAGLQILFNHMPVSEALVGRQFANFSIRRLLGRGGMAEVYYGWDVKLERPVALKIIDARYRNDPLYAQRFVHEARAMAAWHHPNIIPIYYADDEAGYTYYVMEYIQGMDLEQILNEYKDRNELIPHADAIRIGRAAADALDYAHRHGVIHRDVKPSNLLISADNRVVLTDFGLALSIQIGSIGSVFGSPHYIAPEQARNSSQAVPQSDLYALSVILYQMLTGALPFDDPSPASLAVQHLTLDPPPPRQINPSLSAQVEAVLLTGLSKSPSQRFQSGKELMDALEAALNVTAQTSPYLPQKTAGAETAEPPSPRLSQTSLLEIVAEGQEVTAPGLPGETSGLKPIKLPVKPSLLAILGIGCGAIIVLGGLAFLITSLLLNPNRQRVQANALPIATETLPALTSTILPTQSIPPSQTAVPAAIIPTSTYPAEETQVTSTLTPPTETLPAPTFTIVVTNPPPHRSDGDLFIMYYDDTGFYIKNLSGKDRSVFPLAFERLDNNGKPVNRVEGWYWGNIYSKFRANYCLVLEILNFTDHLSPKECKNRYLVIRTPTLDSGMIFWTKEKNSKEFRVLWNDEEVGRCKIAEGTCEVYLP